MTSSVSGPATQQRVTAAIAQASARTGVPFDYLLGQAQVESGLRPDAKAKTSSATGLYQFTNQTWLGTVKRHGAVHGLDWASQAISQRDDGSFAVTDPALRHQILDLRNHPETAAVMAAEFASDNGAYLESRMNGDPAAVDLYLAHFLGAKGAGDFLSAMQADPDQAAAPLFPTAAAANRSVFFGPSGQARSLREIRDGFSAKLASGQAGSACAQGVTTQRVVTESRQYAPLKLASFEKMPDGLDLDFARKAYQRLSGLSV